MDWDKLYWNSDRGPVLIPERQAYISYARKSLQIITSTVARLVEERP